MEFIVELFKDVYNTREINMKKATHIAEMFKKNRFGCLSITKKCFIQIMNSIYSLKMFPRQNLEIFEVLLKKILKKLSNKQKNEADDQLLKNICEEFLKFFSEDFIRSPPNIQIFKSRFIVLLLRTPLLPLLSFSLLDRIFNISLFLLFQMSLRPLALSISSILIPIFKNSCKKNVMESFLKDKVQCIKEGEILAKKNEFLNSKKSGVGVVLAFENNTQILTNEISNEKNFYYPYSANDPTDFAKQEQFLKKEKFLKKELLRIVCEEDNKELKKAALDILEVDQSNWGDLVQRIRDQEKEIQEQIWEKLGTWKGWEGGGESMKMIYDGFWERSGVGRGKCLKFFKIKFNLIGRQEESADNIVFRMKIINFLKLFPLEKLLVRPKLYRLMNEFINAFIEYLLEYEENLLSYIRNLILSLINNFGNKNLKANLDIQSEEIFFFKILCFKYYQREAPAKLGFVEQEICNILDDSFPNIKNIIKMMYYFKKKKDILAIYELMQIFRLYAFGEECSRIELMKQMRILCLNTSNYFEGAQFYIDDENDEYNDVYREFNIETKEYLFYYESHIDSVIITNSEDLIPQIMENLSLLFNNDNNLINFVFEMICEIREVNEIENNKSWMDEIENLKKIKKENQSLLLQLETNIKRKPYNLKDLITQRKEIIDCQERIEDQLFELKNTFEKINIRCLNLLINLLRTIGERKQNHGYSQLLGSLIGPLLMYFDNPKIKQKALFSLSLFILPNKELCLEYFSLFYHFLESILHKKEDSDELCEVISIKFMFDFLSLNSNDYDPSKNDETNEKFNLLLIKFKQLLFKSEIKVKRIVIEGLCKIVALRKFNDVKNLFNHLVLIWINYSLFDASEHFIIQISSLFIKSFIFSSAESIQIFEKHVEVILEAFLRIYNAEIFFNKECIKITINEDFLLNFLKIVLFLIDSAEKALVNENNRIVNIINEKVPNDDDGLTAQEGLFLFFCLKFKNYKRKEFSFFEKFIGFFNVQKLSFVDKAKFSKISAFLKMICKDCPNLLKRKFFLKFIEFDMDNNVIDKDINAFVQNRLLKNEKVYHESRELLKDWKTLCILDSN